MTQNECSLALDEWKEAQRIVIHHEQLIYHIRGWLITLVTAISIAALKHPEPIIGSFAFIGLGGSLVFLFYALEMYMRVPLHRTIKRAREIEASMRREKEYDGLRLSACLGEGSNWEDIKEYCWRGRMLWPYGVVLTIIITIAIVSYNS